MLFSSGLFPSSQARRAFLRTLSAGVISFTPALSMAQETSEQTSGNGSPLDDFIHRYMKAMNAPGLTLALANKTSTVRTAGFGYTDVEQKLPVTPELLFEIGSITKSFVALTLLQLREEGKLDLHKPVLDYLPWAPIQANYGEITIHHLLTHSSGLPDALGLFLTDPDARHTQGFAPGSHFHYANVGFTLLGYVIQTLDQRPWPDAVRSRIFEPLGMTSSRAVITDDTRVRRARSYVPFYTEGPYARQGRLAPAGDLIFKDAAGSITSTPGDMARYMQMLLNRGQVGGRRVVSEESFALFSTPYIKSPVLSPTSFYGYGIGVDKVDGHTVLRHTGGMTSFASSILVDLDGGVAAFASINAMQGYRPVPVTDFAVQLMNAETQKTQAPHAPELPAEGIKNAGDYAGAYSSADGKRVELVAQDDRLLIRADSASVPLEHRGGDVFLATAPGWEHFPLVFGRAAAAKDSRQKGAVVELAHGADWYTNDKYSGPRTYPVMADLQQFTGSYQSGSDWMGNLRIVERKGKLWAEGTTPLARIGNALFRFGEQAWIPDTAQFFYIVGGKAQLMKLNGADLWRISD